MPGKLALPLPALLPLLALLATPARAQTPSDPAVLNRAEPMLESPADALLLPLPGAESRFNVRFDQALHVRTDRLLEGVSAATHVDFTVPGAWDLLDDPVLDLRFGHSAALQPDRSHLTVSLNGTAVSSVALDATNGADGRLRIVLPRALLNPYNQLTFRAVQHYGATCEDPFDPSLWTQIGKNSGMEMVYRRRPVVPDLATLPFPLVDPTGYGPTVLTLVLAPKPSSATLQALGALGVAYGRLADYRGVQVADAVAALEDAQTHALLVGTFGETPEIRLLLGDVSPKPKEGLVALLPNPSDPTRAVLVVTGADAEGLRRAALTLASENRRVLLSGAQARVEHAADGRPPRSRRDPPVAPPTPRFNLDAIGLGDRTVRGFHTAPITVPIELEGSAAVRPGGAEATLHYAYAAGLDPRLSAMEVRLDGVSLKSVPLDPKGSDDSTLTVTLPDAVMRPRSRLEVAFTLFPGNFDVCHFTSDRTLWGTVFADTELRVERDQVAMLPDLGRLRYGAWPFTLDAADGAVVVALPDQPTADDASAGFLLAAGLGRWSTAEVPALQLLSAGDVTFDDARDRHFVLLSDGAPHALLTALTRDGGLSVTGAAHRTLVEGGQRVLSVSVRDTGGRIEEVLHPSNTDKATLVLTTARGGDLRDLVDAVIAPERTAALSGTAALLGERGTLRTLDSGTPHQVGSYSIGASFLRTLSQNWILIGIAMVAGALLFTQAKRAWVRNHEEAS